jgi:BirA family biotin operon repressor/biotin-[acetyl-CoA-carboxylase] ligase
MFTVKSVLETGSTNDDAARVLGEPGSEGLVILASHQREGHGRHTRRWVAPPGSGLLFTMIAPRRVAASALWAVPFWTALAVAHGIAEYDVTVGLQWPNDLLLDGRKCGGILCISRVSGPEAWIGCGVGLNVHRPVADAELDRLDPPPAFLDEAAPRIDLTALFGAILGAFARSFDQLDRPNTVARAWEARAGLRGTPYRLQIDGEAAPFDAIADRLSPEGGLVVISEGRERTIALADARVLRR